MRETDKIYQVLKHLRRYGSITKMKAASSFYLYNLKHTINSLIMKGYNIVTEMIARPGRQSYAKYKLIGGKV